LETALKTSAFFTTRAWFLLSGILRRDIGKNRRYAFHVADEPHVIVPFVTDAKRFDAASHRMLGELRELWCPPRINRPKRLEVAAHPLFVVVALLTLVDFNAVVNRHESRAATHRCENLRILGSSCAMIQSNHDRVGVREIRRPILARMDDRVDVWINLVQGSR
jgi:hypothetical protein